ncbi:hypothetical protein FZEAL_8221 [Fusarium zealandicum]|uniref:Uncharacterized protein n=1 Tax=Fusarium zealandicum TaxID=1053134 RepID=A0A8H4XH43_9HYPO|nr:hypothetical protein FZEAL_8221 [Fusarium zealandicum]
MDALSESSAIRGSLASNAIVWVPPIPMEEDGPMVGFRSDLEPKIFIIRIPRTSLNLGARIPFGSNQHELGARSGRDWGTDSLEGVVPNEELVANLADQSFGTTQFKFWNGEYYKSREYKLAGVQVPILSIANGDGIHLRLRGNVLGYLGAGSQLEYLRFIAGRHDVPMYYDTEVAVQKSFLNECLLERKRSNRLVYSWKTTTTKSPPPQRESWLQ